MVYTFLATITTTRHLLHADSVADSNIPWPSTAPYPNEPIRMLRRWLPTSILRTSTLIRAEALPIFQPLFSQMMREPLRFIVDNAGGMALTHTPSPLSTSFSPSIHRPLTPAIAPFVFLSRANIATMRAARRQAGVVDVQITYVQEHDLHRARVMLGNAAQGVNVIAGGGVEFELVLRDSAARQMGRRPGALTQCALVQARVLDEEEFGRHLEELGVLEEGAEEDEEEEAEDEAGDDGEEEDDEHDEEEETSSEDEYEEETSSE
jgi:hypothetical protein